VESEVPIRLILVAPPAGVSFGIQKGSGVRYETLFVQQRRRRDVCFDFSVMVRDKGRDSDGTVDPGHVCTLASSRFIADKLSGQHVAQSATPGITVD
jgi:hypothetical protein